MKIAIITDGSVEMGMGHIYRTLTLAKDLKNIGKDVCFLTRSDKDIENKINSSGFLVFRCKNDLGIISKIKELCPDVIIIDRPELEVEKWFVRDIRKLNNFKKIVLFDNFTEASKYADIVINPMRKNCIENKIYYDINTDTLYMYGLKYLIFREEFYICNKKDHYRDSIERILLSFGGSDPQNFTSKVLDKILSLNEDFRIDIILGPKFTHYKELYKVINKYKNKNNLIKIYKEVNHISKLMVKSDIVITSFGLTMFESLFLEVPTLAICQNRLQEESGEIFTFVYNKSAIKNIDELIFNIYKQFPRIIDEIKKIEIGCGKSEVIGAIINTDYNKI